MDSYPSLNFHNNSVNAVSSLYKWFVAKDGAPSDTGHVTTSDVEMLGKTWRLPIASIIKLFCYPYMHGFVC